MQTFLGLSCHTVVVMRGAQECLYHLLQYSSSNWMSTWTYLHNSSCRFSFHRNTKWKTGYTDIIIQSCYLSLNLWSCNGDFISFIIRVINLKKQNKNEVDSYMCITQNGTNYLKTKIKKVKN